MSKDTNSKLSTMAKAFPGNTGSEPDFVNDDALFKTAFEIYKAGYPANEFTGLPVAEDLMRQLGEQLQSALDGQQSIPDALKKAQESWTAEF
jgi:multiple sugar transport system substrate-binding protein